MAFPALVALSLLAAGWARAEYVQTGKLLVAFEAGMAPTKLPRDRAEPVKVGLKGSFENLDASDTPALDTMVVRLSRGGRIESRGLPRCRAGSLRGRTSEEAMKRCGSALIGRGQIESALRFPDGRRSRSTSRLLLFNVAGGILMHVYTAAPLRGTFLVPMRIEHGSGAFGTVLRAKFPHIASGYGYLTGFSMRIWRRYSHRGVARSYVMASCPAPAGYPRVSFELARVTYRFRNGVTVNAGTIGSCQVKG